MSEEGKRSGGGSTVAAAFEDEDARRKGFRAVQEVLMMLPPADSTDLEGALSQVVLEHMRGLLMKEFKLNVISNLAVPEHTVLPLMATVLATLRADKLVLPAAHTLLLVLSGDDAPPRIPFPYAVSNTRVLTFPVIPTLHRSRIAADIVRFLRCHQQLQLLASHLKTVTFSTYCDLDSLETALKKLQGMSFPAVITPCRVALRKTDPAISFGWEDDDLILLSPSFTPGLFLDWLTHYDLAWNHDTPEEKDRAPPPQPPPQPPVAALFFDQLGFSSKTADYIS